MAVTEHGLQQVEDAHRLAKEALVEAELALSLAKERMETAAKQLKCKHEHIECTGGFIYIAQECKTCGFTWYD